MTHRPQPARTRPEWTVDERGAGLRLDKFLAAPDRLGSRARVATALERGKVFLNEVESGPRDAGVKLVAGDVVRLWIDRPGSATRQPAPFKKGALDILYEDDALIVLNKPAGLLSVPLERRSQSPSIVTLLEDYFRSSGKRKPFVVHRIDLDTSGLVVFAKTRAGAGAAEGPVPPPRTRARLLGGGLRTPVAAAGHVARSSGVGHEGADPEADPPVGSDAAWMPSARIACSNASRTRRSSRCGSTRASAIRSASRRACAGTRWSARRATSTAPTRFGRSSSDARRCTRTAWRSGTRPTIGRSSSRRRCRSDFTQLLRVLRQLQ